ncbi:MAG: hypothetical protein OHK0022_21930 [Roseiflexaceae bacterium]
MDVGSGPEGMTFRAVAFAGAQPQAAVLWPWRSPRGSRARVTGYLRTRSWEQDGVKHYRTEVVAEDVLFLDRRSDDQAEAQEDAPEEIDL